MFLFDRWTLLPLTCFSNGIAATEWWNSYLEPRGYPVTDLCTQIRTGVLLVRLIEALEGIPPAPVRRGKIRICIGAGQEATANPKVFSQCMENLNLCLVALMAPAPAGTIM